LAKRPSKPDSPEQIKLAATFIAHASAAGARAPAPLFSSGRELNVSGITQSKPARVLLNSRLAYEGDVATGRWASRSATGSRQPAPDLP